MAEQDAAPPQKKLRPPVKIVNAAVHPLVLLSVADHSIRTLKKKRVVGVILGMVRQDGVAEITNAFAVPFDEDKKSGGFFLDHKFVEDMFSMFKRVSAVETILGWYHSGGDLKSNDIVIHQSFRRYTRNPLLLVVNVSSVSHELPVKAYLSKKTTAVHSVEEVDTFFNVDVQLVASPPEEVGVEHVLRDVQDQEHVPTLTEELRQKKTGLAILKERVQLIRKYLVEVKEGKMPINQDILYLLQELFNIMPDVNNPTLKASIIKTNNDQTLSIYVASIVQAVLSLDQVITNRAENLQDTKPQKKASGKKAEGEAGEKPADKGEQKKKGKEAAEEKK